jgi:hypothetical protein
MLQMFWIYYNQLLARLHCPIFSRRVTTRPYNRIPSDEFRQADLLGEAIAFPFIVAFGGVFAFGWRFHFPSEAERILWRIAASYTLGYSILGCFRMKLCDDVILPRTSRGGQGGQQGLEMPKRRKRCSVVWFRGFGILTRPRILGWRFHWRRFS